MGGLKPRGTPSNALNLTRVKSRGGDNSESLLSEWILGGPGFVEPTGQGPSKKGKRRKADQNGGSVETIGGRKFDHVSEKRRLGAAKSVGGGKMRR